MAPENTGMVAVAQVTPQYLRNRSQVTPKDLRNRS
ncbi:hypothetical protein JOF47_000864 [Paeniglutamicibacter kerguelensis]|uniref:Uncharacterized protein n=1 Tax=Paeniglutamicibacter kerguelensis TaxID=254788 RepID=A0ABS4XAF8_9MICC|nr:hypothetical protein [Paeniglutamicibacter kerguelensis]